ncbi:MAG: hypothetical protein ACRDXE_01405 [Acidimicrobiales bacterium]
MTEGGLPGHGEGRPPRPPARGRRWTSFVNDAPDVADAPGGTGAAGRGRVARGLHEDANPAHRLRVEHDPHTLLIHLSDEDGRGWTTIAVDRPSRLWAIAQGRRQTDTARDAYEDLYQP